MQQNPSKEQALLDKYNRGLTDPQDSLRIEHAFNLFAESAVSNNSNIDEELTGLRIWSKLAPSNTLPVRSKTLWEKYAAGIAAAVAVITFGLWFFIFQKDSNNARFAELHETKHIVPGHAGATLIMSNGTKINLSDVAEGALAQQDGVKISKTSAGELRYETSKAEIKSTEVNTLSTRKGQTYILHLPDGTTVWLNAASSLSYSPNLLRNGKRVVELTGEGYFEVQKSKYPFLVKTNNQQVEVLGTKFNISSYHDEPLTATTLTEGSVKVRSRTSNLLLIPGQQAVNNGNSMEVRIVDVSEVNAWKDGYFRFSDQKLSVIASRLERWYDVEIRLGPGLSERQFTGKISRKRELLDVLKLLKKTNDIIFKIEGRRISIIER